MMDLHPTPFPGKRRSVAKSLDEKNDKVTKRPPWQPPTSAASAQIRPKRAFGVVRSSNILIDKPRSKPLSAEIDKPYKESKTCKPYKESKTGKPSVPSTVPVKSSEPTEKSSDTGRRIGRLKVASKNSQHVSFQELKEGSSRSPGKGKKNDAACTPAPLKKTVAVETPYHSAQNCSKCRLDKLESSAYWLTQIRLAESEGNHFVSAAFFRLALQCRAQPFQRLQSELRSYVVRHHSNSLEPVWTDLRKAYSLPAADLFNEEKKNTLLVEFKDSVSEAVQEFCKLDLFDASMIQEEDPSQGFYDEILSSGAGDEECFLCHDLQDPITDGLKNISIASDTSSAKLKYNQEDKLYGNKAHTIESHINNH